MFDQAFEGFPAEIQSIKVCVFPLQPGDDAKRLGIVIKAAEGGHELVELALAGVAKRCVAKVMGQGQGFGEILIEAEYAGNRPCYLGNLDRMGKPGAVVVALVIHENLGLMLQSPEGGRVNYPVAVALKGGARRTLGFREQPSPALFGFCRVDCRVSLHLPHH